MAGDYVPHSEVKLIGWAEGFVAFLEEHAGETRIPPGEVAAARLELEEYAAAYDAHKVAQAAARAACSTKDTARKPLVKHLRSLAGRMHTDQVVDSEVKTVAEAVIGKSPRPPKLSISDDRPHPIISGGQRLTHVFRVMNENSHSIHRARPSDAMGCELWRRIGDDTDEWHYVGLVCGDPFVVRYSVKDGGRQVHYRFRWVTRGGKTSAWSDTKSATVAT